MSRRASASRAAPRAHREPPAAAAPIEASAARLKGHAPLVPVQSAASRALVGVIAILTFLAALCAGGAELVASHSAGWRSAVGREATVQVRPSPQRDIEADLVRAADLARRTPGITAAEIPSRADAERTLEPWLGKGLDLGDLPVPRLVILKLDDAARPDFSELRRRLAAEVPGATLDDHGAWLARLSRMADVVVIAGLALALLVLIAAALAVAFATQGTMAGNREVVDILHYVGADDAFIAREFQRRFFRLGLRGAAIGAGAAMVLTLILGLVTRSWRASPTGDQIEALFGAFTISWRGYAVVVLIALFVAVITGIVSRLTVRRFLNENG
jgi:cell division transport system permease protein